MDWPQGQLPLLWSKAFISAFITKISNDRGTKASLLFSYKVSHSYSLYCCRFNRWFDKNFHYPILSHPCSLFLFRFGYRFHLVTYNFLALPILALSFFYSFDFFFLTVKIFNQKICGIDSFGIIFHLTMFLPMRVFFLVFYYLFCYLKIIKKI